MTTSKLCRLAAIPLLLSLPLAARAQDASNPAPSPEAQIEPPILNKLPEAADQESFAKAEEDVLLPDLAVLRGIYAGEELKEAQLSLSGYAFLETFTASMAGPLGDPPQAQRGENQLRLEIYRIARKAIMDRYAGDPKASRDFIFLITRFRNSLLKTAPPFSLVSKWKEVVAEQAADAEAKPNLRLPVSPELLQKIGGLKYAEGADKAAVLRFFDLQQKLIREEIAILRAKPKK